MSPDRRMARQSLKEEREAVRVYSKRIRRAKDPRLVRALRHARREEREHAASFKRLAPQLGTACSRSSRVSRGFAGGVMGAFAGSVLGLLVGGALGARKLAAGAPGEPISAGLATAVGVTAVSAVAGAIAFAWAPEC